MDQHRTKPILVCWGHAMYTPTLIAGHEAIFEFAAETFSVLLILITYYLLIRYKTYCFSS